MTDNEQQFASEEQRAYATVMDWGTKLGFVLLVLTFIPYVFGFVEPHVPLEKMPQLWSMPVDKYLEEAHVKAGWDWVSLIYKGDYMNFIGIIVLSSVVAVCYIRVIPIFAKKKEYIFVVIGILELAIIALAASGILVSGH